MKRIYINSQLLSIANNYAKDPFITRTSRFSKPLAELSNLKRWVQDANMKIYIQKIIDEYTPLNSIKPSKITAKKAEFDLILPEVNLRTKLDRNGNVAASGTEFYKKIVAAMKYTELREEDFLPNITKLGIKSCVYCNSQLAIVTEKTRGGVIARLELDHFYPKSKYPFLCTSFFNLYPVCGNCNRSKSYNPIKFELYTENMYDEVNPFNFRITKKSKLEFLKCLNDSVLEIKFHSKGDHNILSKDHDQHLNITGIYNTQKDLVGELIRKQQIYTEAYKRDLLKRYQPLIPTMTILNRLIIGNFDSVDDIHKRPMAKFTQDISKQIKLIK